MYRKIKLGFYALYLLLVLMCSIYYIAYQFLSDDGLSEDKSQIFQSNENVDFVYNIGVRHGFFFYTEKRLSDFLRFKDALERNDFPLVMDGLEEVLCDFKWEGLYNSFDYLNIDDPLERMQALESYEYRVRLRREWIENDIHRMMNNDSLNMEEKRSLKNFYFYKCFSLEKSWSIFTEDLLLSYSIRSVSEAISICQTPCHRYTPFELEGDEVNPWNIILDAPKSFIECIIKHRKGKNAKALDKCTFRANEYVDSLLNLSLDKGNGLFFK